MNQVNASYNQCSKKVHNNSNHKGDIFKEFQEDAYNKRLVEILECYANINRKQGITREQLM